MVYISFYKKCVPTFFVVLLLNYCIDSLFTGISYSAAGTNGAGNQRFTSKG